MFAQTYTNIELIIIDDGSNDNSVEVIQKVIAKAPKSCKVKFKYRANHGAHVTINEGLDMAQGEFLTILNSDDYFHPKRIAILTEKLDAQSFGLALSRVHHIDNEGEPLMDAHPMREWYVASLKKKLPSVGFRVLYSNIAVTSGNLLFTKKLYQVMGGFKDFKLCHDYDFLLRALFYTEPVFVNQPLIIYRSHGMNTITQFSYLEGLETPQVAFNYFKEAILNPKPINKKAPCRAYWKEEFEKFWEDEEECWMRNWVGKINPMEFL